MDKILIVDDDHFNRIYLENCFERYGFTSLSASNGIEGLGLLMENHHTIKAITLDIEMPKLNGYQFAEIVKSDEKLKNIPIIFVTSVNEKNNILKGLELFAFDYFIKPIDPQFLYYKVRNAVAFYNQHLKLKTLNFQVNNQNKKLENRLKINNEKLNKINNKILNMLESANYYNDEDTGNHIQRVAEYSVSISKELGLNYRIIDSIKTYSPLHDIGKVGIPDSILKKPGKLTEEEFNIMKKHVQIGVEFIKELELPCTALNIVKYHHEKWNGSGYLNNLKGSEIPLEARIVALADVFDALTTKRCYKEAFSYEKSIEIIKNNAGTHFDPDLVKIFLKIKIEIIDIMNRLKD